MRHKQHQPDTGKTYSRIGGWLILCAVGLVLYPLQTLYLLISKMIPAVMSDNWTALTSPANPGYHSLWAPLVIAELVGSIGFFLCSLVVIIFFFRRHHRAPGLIIAFMIANILFVGADYFMINFFLIRSHSVNVDTTINFVRTVVAGAVWIPYLIFSKRVDKTFTR